MKKGLALIALVATLLSVDARAANTGHRAGLGSVEQFKTAFNNDRGKVRLVALVSPT